MRNETKKMIAKDIVELIKWCKENGVNGYTYYLNKNGQNAYLNLGLLERTLCYKKKDVLDKIREEIMEKVVYA